MLVAEGISRATVPMTLAHDIARAAVTTAATSPRVLALAQRFGHSAFFSPLRVVAIVIFAGSLIGGFTFVVGDRPSVVNPAQSAENAQPNTDHPKPPVDLYGDPLPPDAMARLGTVRLRHGADVWTLAFAPDGKTLLSGSYDKTARLWDVATGKELHQFPSGGQLGVKSVAFADEGKKVFTGSDEDDGLRHWDAASGREAPFSGRPDAVGSCLAVSGDGTTLAVARGSTVQVRDSSTGNLLRELENPPRVVNKLALSSDGKQVAAAGRDGLVRVWNAITGNALQTLSGHNGPVSAVAFSPDGKTLASGGYDKTVRMWEVATGKKLGSSQEHEAFVDAVAFSPDGKLLVSAGHDWFIRFWDPETAKELRHIKGHLGPVTALAFSPDGKTIASGGSDNVIRFWDAGSGAERPVAKGIMGRVGSVAFLPDSKTIVSGSDEAVRVWDAITGSEVRRLTREKPCHSYYVAVSRDGRLAASGNYDDHKIRVWQITTGKEIAQLDFPKDIFVPGLAFSPNGGTLASTCDEGTIQLWDVASAKELRRMEVTQKGASRVVFAPEGKTLATTSAEANGDHTIRFWHAASGKELRRLDLYPRSAFDIALSPNGKVLAAVGGRPGRLNDSSEVRFWDIATGEELPPLRGLTERGTALAFSPDGRMLATAEGLDRSIRRGK
jgi:WD40 repeat protein